MVDVLAAFHPLVAGWFRERFGEPTDPQRDGWPHIAAGDDVLIAAPTGSGKTLAAFLACMDALVRRGLQAPLDDHTDILYISPLKALSNDVQRNLEAPLVELATYAAARGVELPTIRVGVRTGDTPAGERAKMAKRPPHILVTTPESLYILLTSEKGRAALAQLRTVIVDEIHAVAGDKRGAHLALSLERLDRLVRQTCGRVPVRVGLSATQRPIERIARLLVGTKRPLPHIVDSGHRREIDLAIEITDDELGAVASLEQFSRVYDRIAELVQQHRSTIVFVNTRRLVERAAAALEQRLGEEHVVAHHGSMSRTLRLAAEQKLKHGHVKCAVATASLELGIDVGAVDLVVQLGSPRSIATLLQRVGRSGHNLGATPKGRLFALTRDQLVECASLVRGVRRGNLDRIHLRDAPLDILAQQIVATCAAEDIDETELADMIRGAAPYEHLDDARLEQLLTMLSEGVADRRGRGGAHLHRDRVGGRLKARRGARLAAITCGGAIPDNNNYAVVQWPEEMKVGEVDEDFAIDSSAGDIFQLGNTAWRIKRVETSKVIVEDAKGQPPTIPFWFGEAPARTAELSDEVSDLRGEIDRRLGVGEDLDLLAAWLAVETSMPTRAAQQMIAYLAASRMALGALPRKDLLVAERFFDEAGGMQLVLHSPLGGRINRAWGLALRKKFCVTFDFELQAAATDDGIVISLGQPHSFPLETVFAYVRSHQAEETLIQALLDRPMFEIRWRWNVTRSLTVLRRRAGKKIPPHLVKMRAADTLSVVFPQAVACGENITGPREVPDHPLVFETIRDCLVEAMDLEGLRTMIEKLERGEIQVMARDTVEPSPLSHELINANPYAFLDDAPLEERRARAVQMRRGLPANVVTRGAEDVGALDPLAIAAASEEVAPIVRDTDELHDALMLLWLVPEGRARGLAAGVEDWFDALARCGRAVLLRWQVGELAHSAWVATERLGSMRAVFGADIACTPMIATPSWSKLLPREQAIQKIISSHLDAGGPISGEALADGLGLPLDDVLGALLALEGDGGIMRGAFTEAGTIAASAQRGVAMRAALAAADDSDALRHLEWCNRRVLARIHRLTLAKLRKEIEPVGAAALMRFLVRWQRVAKHTQVIGADGLARIIEQLQGFETAAGAWEREVLPARLHGYDQGWLDQLCLAGHVVWARLSPRAQAAEADEETTAEAKIVDRGPRKKLRSANPNASNGRNAPNAPYAPYDVAERAADTMSRSGGSRDEIASAAARALCGTRRPGYGEQVIVQLVTTSALMRRAGEAATNDHPTRDDDVGEAIRHARDVLSQLTNETEPPSLEEVANALIDSADARDVIDARGVAPARSTRDRGGARDPHSFADRAAGLLDSANVTDLSRPRPFVKRSAPSRSAPLALMLRQDAHWLRAAASVSLAEPPTLSSSATQVRDYLAQSGASFLGDITATLRLQPTEIEDALWELVGAGLATADGFASLRVLVDRKRGEVKSLFDRARDAKDAAAPPVRTWTEAIKKARTRDHCRPGHALRSLPTAAGRWSLLPAANPSAISAEATARQLLLRYGVVFRDLVQRESSLPPWRDILVSLRRLEARGEIRGGRFVNGFVGEQFALPEALDGLRAVRHVAPSPCVCRIAATDPLNLVGILTPGARVSSIVGNAILFLDGQAVASIEAGQLVLRAPLPPGARVDEDLVYHPPPAPVQHVSQAALPL